MSSKKIETVLSLIEASENNLKNAKAILAQFLIEKGVKIEKPSLDLNSSYKSSDEQFASEVVEGVFNGENMIGDNGQTYLIPQNYASKTQLVVGDRMKWILTENPETKETKEVFKLIQPVVRERVIGTFEIEGSNYVVLIDNFPAPVKILKASATYAMKNLGLSVGDKVAIYIPKDGIPTWGAFISLVSSLDIEEKMDTKVRNEKAQEHANEVFKDLDDFTGTKNHINTGLGEGSKETGDFF
jgi:hypothetical protein